jgi:hypothetical protein
MVIQPIVDYVLRAELLAALLVVKAERRIVNVPWRLS